MKENDKRALEDIIGGLSIGFLIALLVSWLAK